MSEKTPWKPSPCRVPMWMMGSPFGHCGKPAFGHQYPKHYAEHTGSYIGSMPYCYGHCCPAHGGPKEGEPIIFQDGYTNEGRQMWCAVMPDFASIQESPAGFSGNPIQAVANLRAVLSQGEQK